jgi:hypothetical protein
VDSGPNLVLGKAVRFLVIMLCSQSLHRFCLGWSPNSGFGIGARQDVGSAAEAHRVE